MMSWLSINKYQTTIDFLRDWDRKVAVRIAIKDFNIHPFDIKYKDFSAKTYNYRLQIPFLNKEQFSEFIYKIMAHEISLTEIKIRKGA